MNVKRSLLSALVAAWLVFGLAGGAVAEWGTNELDTEKIAVTFAREVQRGEYKIVATPELKKWLDEKNRCSSWTPCP